MIRVAFPSLGSDGWMGGVNYIRNLLYAISILEDKCIDPFIIAGEKTDRKILALYEPYAKIVTAPFLDEQTFPWRLRLLQTKLFGVDTQLDRLMRKHDIRLISHCTKAVRGTRYYRSIGWIPDFQHLHLPQMFTDSDLARRNLLYSRIAAECDAVILSSHDACADFQNFSPAYADKARVLRFVAQPENRFSVDMSREYIEKKYGFSGKFFYLPNQFWRHKNHRVVFEAIQKLKARNEQILLLCSGHMDDFRNRQHIEELVAFVKSNGLEESIRFLGLIDFDDLSWLMRNCIAVINPSLFEGWSTTVEESKSIGKGMILSDLRVHREQNPPGSIFFDPNDSNMLVEILLAKWHASEGGPDPELESMALKDLERRTHEFGTAFQEIALETTRTLAR